MALRSNLAGSAARLLAIAVFLAISGACNRAPGNAPHAKERASMSIQVTEQNNGGAIRAQVGDMLEVSLPENATTGYRWEPDHLDAHMLQLQNSNAEYPSNKPGGGGTAHFQVKVIATGQTTLSFKQWRRWEGEAGVIKRLSIKVNAS